MTAKPLWDSNALNSVLIREAERLSSTLERHYDEVITIDSEEFCAEDLPTISHLHIMFTALSANLLTKLKEAGAYPVRSWATVSGKRCSIIQFHIEAKRIPDAKK